MTQEQYKNYQTSAEYGLIPDAQNPVFLFSMSSNQVLLDIVNGKLDALQLLRLELFNRGIDEKSGKFIGWKTKTLSDVFKQQ